MFIEGQKAESSSKPLDAIFGRPDAPVSSDSDDSPSPTETAKAEDLKVGDGAVAAEDKKVTAETKVEGEQAKSEVKAEAETTDDKSKEDAKAVSDTKPTVDWDAEDNPYKQKFATIEKQYNDTRAWARNEGAQRQKLQQQLDIINKKLDGTWDPAVDEIKPDPQAVILEAEAKGKMAGSLDAAYRQYGKETVDKDIARYNELFAENPYIQSQVWNSPAPVFAALKTLRDFDIAEKYKTSDVSELIEKVKTEARTELEKELTEKITKQLMDGIAMKGKAPTGITGARAAVKVEGEKAPSERPLRSFFNN